MAVAYDNSIKIDDFGVTSLILSGITIAGTNRAAVLHLLTFSAISAVSGEVDGVGATLISGAKGNDGSSWVESWQVIAPPAGAGKVGRMDWTGSASASLSLITAQGVDQTTPCDGGTYVQGGTPLNCPITSASGDLTTSCCANNSADTVQTTNQTQRTTTFGCADTGPGTANPTHTWTFAGGGQVICGVNFKAAGAAGVTIAIPAGSMPWTGYTPSMLQQMSNDAKLIICRS